MSSKRGQRRKQCVGKARHLSHACARVAARILANKGDNVVSYKCPHCGFYHNGHKPGSNKWVAWRGYDSRTRRRNV